MMDTWVSWVCPRCILWCRLFLQTKKNLKEFLIHHLLRIELNNNDSKVPSEIFIRIHLHAKMYRCGCSDIRVCTQGSKNVEFPFELNCEFHRRQSINQWSLFINYLIFFRERFFLILQSLFIDWWETFDIPEFNNPMIGNKSNVYNNFSNAVKAHVWKGSFSDQKRHHSQVKQK